MSRHKSQPAKPDQLPYRFSREAAIEKRKLEARERRSATRAYAAMEENRFKHVATHRRIDQIEGMLANRRITGRAAQARPLDQTTTRRWMPCPACGESWHGGGTAHTECLLKELAELKREVKG